MSLVEHLLDDANRINMHAFNVTKVGNNGVGCSLGMKDSGYDNDARNRAGTSSNGDE